MDGSFGPDSLSSNTAGSMAINANASGTTPQTLTLTGLSTNANGTSDMVSLLGGGTVNIGGAWA